MDRAHSTLARWLACGLLLAVTLFGSGIAPAASTRAATGPAGTFEEADCPFGLPEEMVEGEDVTCGYLTVPERHEKPKGPEIRLAVAVLEPTRGRATEPPLFMLNGGPGQGSDGLFSLFVPGEGGALADLRDGRQVVLLDQRGTGRSEPSLLCPGDTVDAPDLENPAAPAEPEPDAEQPAGLEGEVAFYEECLAGWEEEGVDLGAYTTAQNAADVAALRVALDYDEVDLLGISYGTRLALTVMRDHPEGIRAVVMGSVVPLEVDVYAGQVVAFDEALRTVFAGCAADPSCDEILPRPERTLINLLERLDESPMAVTYEPLYGGDPIDVEVDGAGFLSLVYLSMFIGPLVGVIPSLIALTDAESPDGFKIVLPIADLMAGGIASGMLLAVSCQDEAAFSSPEAIDEAAKEADVLEPLQTETYYQTSGASLQYICPELGLGASPPIENEPVESDIPALLISGEFDPITPPSYGDLVADTLTNATHVLITGLSHDPISSSPDCAVPMIAQFLEDPDARVRRACANDLQVDFSPGF